MHSSNLGLSLFLFQLLVLSCQVFAPSKFVITYEGEEDESSIFTRDASGNVTNITLPDKLVIMSNHQVSLDPSITNSRDHHNK